MDALWNAAAAVAGALLLAGALGAFLVWRLARRQTGRITGHPARGEAEALLERELTRRTGGDRAPRGVRWARAAALRLGRGSVDGVVETTRSRVTAPFAVAALVMGALAVLLVATAPDRLVVGAVALAGGLGMVLVGRARVRARMRRGRTPAG